MTPTEIQEAVDIGLMIIRKRTAHGIERNAKARAPEVAVQNHNVSATRSELQFTEAEIVDAVIVKIHRLVSRRIEHDGLETHVSSLMRTRQKVAPAAGVAARA